MLFIVFRFSPVVTSSHDSSTGIQLIDTSLSYGVLIDTPCTSYAMS